MLMMFQMNDVWHRQGLFMGMHWGWWVFWIVTILAVLWAFWRVYADERDARHEIRKQRERESELRGRYSRGEISREALIEELSALFGVRDRHVGPAAPAVPEQPQR